MPLTVTFRGLKPEQMKAAVQKAQKQLLVMAGQEALNFFKQRFRESGWIDGGFAAWQARKKDHQVGKYIIASSGKEAGKLLLKTGKLRNSIHIKERGANYMIIGTDLPYAQIHNEGFDGTETVKAHSRKSFKKMMVQRTSLKTKITSSRAMKMQSGTGEVKAFTRHMRMPKRQYMGHSRFLDRRTEMVMKYELDKIR